jgi:pyroglutamyl-peptidase
MSEGLRLLVTGFGAFPGAPFNPTEPLVARLLRLRRPSLSEVELAGHIFPVTYRDVDQQLPNLLASHRPHALLMFGLATRTSYIRIETRARNAVTTLWPDAGRAKPRKGSIGGNRDALKFGPHAEKLLRAAAATGIYARASRDAGSYLCNYLSWRAIEATHREGGPRLAAFVHIPLVPRDPSSHASAAGRITIDQLVDAGEALLLELVKLTRQAGREPLRSLSH